MDRLSIFLTLMTGAVVTGVLVTGAFTLGYYEWPVIGGLALAGFALAWPTAYLISRRIKRKDPKFDHTHAEPSAVPDPDAREV